jgi:SAM-dependent methyltransferase
VLCASLFTHLTYDASLEYLIELRRVLHSGGRVYLSCFVLDDETRGNLQKVRLREEPHGAYFDHPTFFDTFFYDHTWKELFARAGFRPAIFRHGHWRGAHNQQRRPIGFQDLFILNPEG